MSLIHDALQKAEGPKEDNPKKEFPQFVQEGGEEKSKKNTRLIALAVVLVCAMGYLAYDKFYAGKSKTAAIKQTSNPLEAVEARQTEVAKLRGEAKKLFEQGNLDEAWIRLSTISQLDPIDHEAWNNMGLISKRKGDMVKARELYERALQLKPDYPECLNNLAVIDIKEGNISHAKELLAKALSLKPEYADPAFHLALIAEEEGETNLAISYYKKFVELAKDAPTQLLNDVRQHVTDMELE